MDDETLQQLAIGDFDSGLQQRHLASLAHSQPQTAGFHIERSMEQEASCRLPVMFPEMGLRAECFCGIFELGEIRSGGSKNKFVNSRTGLSPTRKRGRALH